MINLLANNGVRMKKDDGSFETPEEAKVRIERLMNYVA